MLTVFFFHKSILVKFLHVMTLSYNLQKNMNFEPKLYILIIAIDDIISL